MVVKVEPQQAPDSCPHGYVVHFTLYIMIILSCPFAYYLLACHQLTPALCIVAYFSQNLLFLFILSISFYPTQHIVNAETAQAFLAMVTDLSYKK
jgi:hypothetical protein